MAIFAVFAGGINVYDRVRGYSDAKKDILLSLEGLERDLRNTCNISELEFRGENTRVTFPALIKAGFAGTEEAFAPGSVSYYVDDHYLVSEEKDYSAATQEESGKGIVTQIVPADSVKFSYYYYEPKTETYIWADTWVKEADEDKKGTDASKLGTAAEEITRRKEVKVYTPIGVKIEIGYEDNGRTDILTRTVYFPLAVSLRIAEAVAKKEKKAKST